MQVILSRQTSHLPSGLSEVEIVPEPFEELNNVHSIS